MSDTRFPEQHPYEWESHSANGRMIALNVLLTVIAIVLVVVFFVVTLRLIDLTGWFDPSTSITPEQGEFPQ